MKELLVIYNICYFKKENKKKIKLKNDICIYVLTKERTFNRPS